MSKILDFLREYVSKDECVCKEINSKCLFCQAGEAIEQTEEMTKCLGCQKDIAKKLLSSLDKCPSCTEKWVSA